jgi:purine-binding chemotaxis protein CheW
MTSPGSPHIAHYITFSLAGERFAISVSHVREVLDLTTITRVPTAPAYMRGVVNVRGSAIPVVDLRLKLGLQRAVDDLNTRILVLELEVDGERAVIGALADSVHDVVEIQPTEVVAAPHIAMRWRSDLIQGMAKRSDQFIMMLDITRVFASDVAVLDAAGATFSRADMS